MAHRITPAAQAGFSLIEILGALAIFAVLLLLAAPSYARWMAEQRLMNEARRLSDSLMQARSAAIRHNTRVQVCKSAGTTACSETGGWDQGWVMFVDRNGNGDPGADEEVLAAEPAASKSIRITGNSPIDDYVSFTALAMARQLNGALQMGTFRVCAPGLTELRVVLANSGRTRIERAAATCP